MAYKRGLINLNQNAGIAAMAGGVGNGFANAGNIMMKYGQNANSENMYDDKVKLEADLLKKADAEAKRKEDKADAEKADLYRANAAKNTALNPAASAALIKSFGLEKDSPLAQPGSPSNASAALGMVDLGKPDKTESPKYSNKFLGEDGFMYLVKEGTGEAVNTGVKGKDYWETKGKDKKTDVPDGYMAETEIRDLNANGGELRHMIASMNGFIEKGGIEYISAEAYNLAKDKLKKNGSVDDLNIK